MNNFFSLIDKAIEVNKSNREVHAKFQLACGPLAWAVQFCTVKIDVGRVVGKTSYITKNAMADDLIIVDNPQLGGIYKREGVPSLIVSANEGMDRSLAKWVKRDGAVATVFVDDAGLIPKKYIEMMYHSCAGDPSTTFLLLG